MEGRSEGEWEGSEGEWEGLMECKEAGKDNRGGRLGNEGKGDSSRYI